jgi:hypothetical protein
LNPRIAGNHIEAQRRINGFGKIEAEAEKLGLGSKMAKIRIIGNNRTLCGTDSTKNTSIEPYEHVWKGLLDWSITHEE